MKLTDVTIQNFLALGEAKLSLDALGLVHVSGENTDDTSADSNGSGKSSIGDAISWCFWGTTARGVGGDEVVNTAAEKDCSVSIIVEDEGDTYRVTRYRKFAKHKNAVHLHRLDAGAWTDLTKGTNALTQRSIERLLGCSEEVFNAAVYSGQEMMPDIPMMTDKQLKLLVEQAAGVDVLANAYELARERLRERSQKRAEAQIALDRAVERHTDATTAVERLSDRSNAWDTGQVGKIATLKKQTTDAIQESNLAKEDLNEEDEKQLLADIEECEGKIAAVTTERQREQVLLADLTNAQAALAQVQSKTASEETIVNVRTRVVTTATDTVERTRNGVGKPCETCSRPLEKEHLAEAIAAAEAKVRLCEESVEDAVGELAGTKVQLVAAEKMVTAAQQGLDKHRAAMTDVSDEGDKLRNMQRELQIIAAGKAEVERLRQRAITIAAQWKAEAAAANPFKIMIDEGNQTLIARATTVTTARATAQATTEEEKYAQAVVDVFAPAGVRAHRLDEATPYLNERTAHYLGSLADGAIEAYWTTLTETKGKGDLREKFSVTVESANAPSFRNLSGGEKRKVRLACALALQDLVATRASKSLSLWIGDEIDDALDPAGLERLMGVLEEKARDRGTVLVVSHNDIAAFARKSIMVTKAQGRSTVTVQ